MGIVIHESFSDEDAPILQKIVRKEFESGELARLKVESEEISHDHEINDLISYPEIKKNLEYELPHQKQGAIKILRDLNCTALLADEVGLGKTITTGMILKESIARGFVKKALILTPPSLVDQWKIELRDKFDLDFHVVEHNSEWGATNFAIASIDRVKGYDRKTNKFKHESAHAICWDLLIVDEAHKLKDKNTVRWTFVDKIPKKRFLILTATPFQNDLLELYSLLNLLKRGHLGTINEFKKKFLFKGNKRHPLNPQELKSKLDEVMVRRRRSETNVDYKQRIPKIVPVEFSPEEMEIYKDIGDLLQTKYFACNGSEIKGRLIIYSLLPKMTSSSRSALESLKKIVDGPKYSEGTKEIAQKIIDKYKTVKKDSKIEALISLVKDIYQDDPKAKILMYTKHPTTAGYIREKLEPLGLSVVEFIGGCTREEKQEIIKEFKTRANVMISTETGAEGLNFQFCNNLINYDLPWNPMAVEQRIGRLDRIGQQRDMHIYSLAIKGTMEERIVDLIINKMCCIGLVIGELPIILFNLGLDSHGEAGMSKIEEALMNAFIDSKNNLDKFSTDLDKIVSSLEQGIQDYLKTKESSSELLDNNGENNGQPKT